MKFLAMVLKQPLCALLCVVLASCCTTLPAEKYFPRDRSAKMALHGFVYAVDAGQWQYAFETLSHSSRREFGERWGKEKFVVAVKFHHIDVPIPGGEANVAVYDMISNALEIRSEPERISGAGERALPVVLNAVDSHGNFLGMQVNLYFTFEDDGWRLDLLRSLIELQTGGAPGPGDLTLREDR